MSLPPYLLLVLARDWPDFHRPWKTRFILSKHDGDEHVAPIRLVTEDNFSFPSSRLDSPDCVCADFVFGGTAAFAFRQISGSSFRLERNFELQLSL